MSWRSFGFYRDFFPRSAPRQAKGGIKAQSKRGSFGESWWAQRWIEVLESFEIGARLGRGRSYARRGQVLDLRVNKGRVSAKVQGSRPKPYSVVIEVKTLSGAEWKKLAKTLSVQALFAAKLLAGEMPQDIEKAFKDTGLSLFPNKLKDLMTECSCPDWSNPCKHIAAVYYLLGEEFDRDPFLLFKLRGMSRQELVGLLGACSHGVSELARPAKAARRRPSEASTNAARRSGSENIRTIPLPPQSLPTDAGAFWEGNPGAPLLDDLVGDVRPPALSAALPRRLGSFPFWRGREQFLEAMEPVYRNASGVGLDAFLGGRNRG